MPKGLEYDTQLNTVYLDVDEKMRENLMSITNSIRRIELILADINKRLEALE
jgi:hypothetical protein